MRGTRWEYSTTGLDDAFETIGSDPFNSPYNVGLRVPEAQPTPVRYTMLLAIARFNMNQRARLTGIRQLVTIGQQFAATDERPAPNYTLERQVTSPWWHFPDGNISWHLRRIGPLKQNVSNPNNADSFQFRYSLTPSLLFETGTMTGIDVTAYVPPYGGQIPGNILIPQFGTWHDMRFPWEDAHSWDSVDIEIEGPCDIALFASVLQTNPEFRIPLVLSGNVPLDILQPEDAFIATNPTSGAEVGPAPHAIYWRVAGSLIFETPNFVPTESEYADPPSLSPKPV